MVGCIDGDYNVVVFIARILFVLLARGLFSVCSPQSRGLESL